MDEALELEESKPIGVYVKYNSDGYVTEINSDIFIKDFIDWQKIDEGYGDKYAHAQSQYLDKEILSQDGKFYFKIQDFE